MNGRRIGLIVVSVGVFAAMNALVWKQESHVVRGENMYLRLGSNGSDLRTGERTLQLEYEIADRVDRHRAEASASGTAVVRLDENGVARFVRPYDEKRLGDDEHLLDWRRGRRVSVGPESCRVDTGDPGRIDRAAYAELVVSESGDPMLVGLADAERQPLDLGCGLGG